MKNIVEEEKDAIIIAIDFLDRGGLPVGISKGIDRLNLSLPKTEVVPCPCGSPIPTTTNLQMSVRFRPHWRHFHTCGLE